MYQWQREYRHFSQGFLKSDTISSVQFYWGNLLLCVDDRIGAFDAFSKCFIIRQKLMPIHFDTAFAAHKLGVMAAQNKDLDASM